MTDEEVDNLGQIWLKRVVERAAKHYIRSVERLRRYEVASLDIPLNDNESTPSWKDIIPSPDPSIEEQVIDREVLFFKDARLTTRQQSLLRIVLQADGKISDVAKTLSISNQSVYQRLQRIRSVLERDGGIG